MRLLIRVAGLRGERDQGSVAGGGGEGRGSVVNAAVGWMARGMAEGVRSMVGDGVGELWVSFEVVSLEYFAGPTRWVNFFGMSFLFKKVSWYPWNIFPKKPRCRPWNVSVAQKVSLDLCLLS